MSVLYQTHLNVDEVIVGWFEFPQVVCLLEGEEVGVHVDLQPALETLPVPCQVRVLLDPVQHEADVEVEDRAVERQGLIPLVDILQGQAWPQVWRRTRHYRLCVYCTLLQRRGFKPVSKHTNDRILANTYTEGGF